MGIKAGLPRATACGTANFQIIKTYPLWGAQPTPGPSPSLLKGSVLVAVEQDDKLDTVDYTVDETRAFDPTFFNAPDPERGVYAATNSMCPVALTATACFDQTFRQLPLQVRCRIYRFVEGAGIEFCF